MRRGKIVGFTSLIGLALCAQTAWAGSPPGVAPAMEGISPAGVITGAEWTAFTGTQDLVFHFGDADGDMADL